MKAMGVVFSNIYDDTLGDLTSHRTVASMPFGGRYRQIDFVLSNMTNSHIYNVGVVTKHNYRSLMDHLGSCLEWDLNRKNGGLVIIPPFAMANAGVYKGKLEALYAALDYIDKEEYDHIVVTDSTVLCNIDYRKVIRQHIASGADVTVIANRDPADVGKAHPFVLTAAPDGSVRSVSVNAVSKENHFVGMGMFVFSRKLLADTVAEAHEQGYYHLERDFIQRGFNEGSLNLAVYEFSGTVLRNEDVRSYYRNNLALLNRSVREGLFLKDRPVYTKVRDEVPTYYGAGSKVENCLAADGCVIHGHVSNSVLFRDVEVAEGAEVEASIVMQGARIGKNARLHCVMLDKNVVVRDGAELRGTPDHPIIIGKGELV